MAFELSKFWHFPFKSFKVPVFILQVRVTPKVEVYDKFSKPDGVREGSMPYTAWRSMTHTHDSSLGEIRTYLIEIELSIAIVLMILCNKLVDVSEKASWLVIAWDRRVQVAQLVKSNMKNFREWSLDSAAIGVAWLDDQVGQSSSSIHPLFVDASDSFCICLYFCKPGVGGSDT